MKLQIAPQNILQFVLRSGMILKRSDRMYEYFEFDVENALFEWDEEKDRLNFNTP